jgi:hypothetical protein
VNALKSWATTKYPDYWLIIEGVLFILIVLFLPKGVFGLLGQLRDLITKRNAKPAIEAPAISDAETAGTPAK